MSETLARLTTHELADLFGCLSPDDRNEFLAKLAYRYGSAVFLNGVFSMNPSERKKFFAAILAQIHTSILPVLVREAVKQAKENMASPDENRDVAMEQKVLYFIDDLTRIITEREQEQVKFKRDRKSDPETIKRNVEICDLRKADQKKWTHSRLGKKYDVTPQAIGLILKEDAKWRQLASYLPSK